MVSYSQTFKKRKIITGTYHASLLDKTKTEIKEKRVHLKEEERFTPLEQRIITHFSSYQNSLIKV